MANQNFVVPMIIGQDEFDYTDIIPQILSNVEIPICQKNVDMNIKMI